MKFPNIKDRNMTFPIRVPIKIRYVYKPAKAPKVL
jgi:hypothetical protein